MPTYRQLLDALQRAQELEGLLVDARADYPRATKQRSSKGNKVRVHPDSDIVDAAEARISAADAALDEQIEDWS